MTMIERDRLIQIILLESNLDIKDLVKKTYNELQEIFEEIKSEWDVNSRKHDGDY